MVKWMAVWDMLTIPEVKDILLSDDMAEIYKLLHDVGFNIDREISVDSCYHRLVNKQIVFGPRFVGSERFDKEWLESGYASEDVWKKEIGKRDVSLLKEIEILGKTSNFTGQIMDHLSNYWGSGSSLTRNIEVAN